MKVALRRAVARGALAHAYLFCGERGLGKADMAMALAQAVNCRTPSEGSDPCGACRDCRQIETQTHPDLCWIVPSPTSIRIEQVRDVIRQAALRPFAGMRKVFIIREAEKLTEEAANGLLKVLEDPPEHVLFILLTDNPDALLPTVRSRCQLMPFRPVPSGELARYLMASMVVDEREARRLSVLARGNPGVAHRLAQTAVLAAARELVQKVMTEVLDPVCSWSRLLRLAEEIDAWGEGHASPLEALDWLSWGCRDLLISAFGGGDDLLVLGAPAANTVEAGRAPVFHAWLRALQQARRAFEANGNRRLVWEVLLQQLHAEMCKAII